MFDAQHVRRADPMHTDDLCHVRRLRRIDRHRRSASRR
jgi:hypothetical protein